MLSELLDTYAAHFGHWSQLPGGVHLDARLLGILSTGFADAADQARVMQGQPVPDTHRPLPPGVVRLDDFRLAPVPLARTGQGDGRPAA